MGFFGFIENFFFISLALVFALVLLLVYHFKNRIAVAEKKSESMYGLLTAVVKEIKSLRGMFGLGSSDPTPSESEPEPEPPTLQVEVKSKLTPEVNVDATVPKTEVITLDFSASDNKKIVVSDDSDEEESDEDDSDEDDDESSIESSDDGNELPLETINISGIIKVNTDDIQTIDDVHVVELTQKLDGLEEAPVKLELVEKVETSLVNETSASVEESPVDENAKDSSPPSIDQLRKMNINQLKTLASQLGIATDINKMKKPELITAIQSQSLN
jgi:hypothetical protein